MAEIIPHWLTKQAYLSPNKIAIESEDGNLISFLELKEASQQYARKISQIGITKGSHVGVYSSNQISMIIIIHAISYLGAVSVLLNTRLTKTELIYQIEDAEITVIVTCDYYKERIKQMNFPVPTKSFSDVNQLEERSSTLQDEIDLDDVFTIIYTSGTTGFPKGVIHTYGNHWWSAIGSALNLGLHKDDKWLATLPIFHVGGLSIFIKSVIYGMSVYLMSEFDEQSVNTAIKTKGITIASVVTVMVERLIHNLETKEYPNSFRCMLLGGGPAPKPLLERAKNHGLPVFQSYGMTETSSQIVTLSPSDALAKIGSAGKPLFPGQVKIVEAGTDSVGEIFVKGPMVSKGYYNNEVANRNSFKDGWLATGDLGFFDDEGFLFVVDRRKDLIISGGENVYPSEIESVLAGLSQIEEVGVIGISDEIWGEVPIAIVVKKEAITSDEVLEFARKHLATYKLPKKIYFVDILPRNASNKLQRSKLLDLI